MDSRQPSSGQGEKLEGIIDFLFQLLPKDILRSEPIPGSQSKDAAVLEKGPEAKQSSSNEQNSQKDNFLVRWDENDAENPQNWSSSYKAFITFTLGMQALCGSLGSSIISPAEPTISKEFNVSTEVTILTISLYVLGFALGPSLWVRMPMGETLLRP